MEVDILRTFTGTIETILDDFSSRIEKVKNPSSHDISHSDSRAYLNAVGKVALVIENIKNVLRPNFNTKFESTNVKVSECFKEVEGFIRELESKKMDLSSSLSHRIEKIISILPTNGYDQPIISNVIATDVQTDEKNNSFVFVKVKGYFPLAGKGYESVINIGKSEISPESETVEELVYKIPSSTYQSSLNEFSYVKTELQINWRVSHLLNYEYKIDKFNVPVCMPPLCPGVIAVEYTSRKVERFSSNRIETCVAWADSHYKKDDSKEVTMEFKVSPSANSFINIKKIPKVSVLPEGSGEHSEPWIESTKAKEIVAKVNLKRCCPKHLGQVNFNVEFEEYQEKETRANRVEWIRDLKWGQKRELNPKDASETVSKAILYTAKGERFQVFDAAEPVIKENRYLQVVYNEGKYRLEAGALSDIPSNVFQS